MNRHFGVLSAKDSLMNAKQLERASYLAAHAILSANVSAPHLATPGARRSYMIDSIADQIRSVFELHCSALDESSDWWTDLPRVREATGLSRDPDKTKQQAAADSQKLQVLVQKLH
jgi:hypothetical protein